MNYYRLSKPVQAIGIACVPIDDIPAGEIIARRPVTVAIVTLATAADGRPTITAECPTAKRDSELPLSYLVDRESITGAESASCAEGWVFRCSRGTTRPTSQAGKRLRAAAQECSVCRSGFAADALVPPGGVPSAEPGLFFEPMLALCDWMLDHAERAPDLYGWAKSRPIMCAVLFENEYRQALAHGDGEPWIRFEEGLSLV